VTIPGTMADDRKAVADWANKIEWNDYIDDNEVYATLLKLQQKLSADGGAGDEGDDGAETRIKLVAVGDGAVGKTSMLISFAKGDFPETYIPTVFENYTAPIDHNDKKILLHLWDTAGQEDYDRLRPLSYPGSDIVILCFSLVTESSFDSVREKWYPEVDHYVKDVPTILVGTKSDLRDAKLPDPSTNEYNPVDNEKAQEMANSIGAEKYIEVSAKTGHNLQQLFKDSVAIVLAARLAQGTSSADKSAAKPSEDDVPQLKVISRTQKTKKKPCTLL